MSMTATKERPILFSGPMVNAIRSGLKTQTRRIVKGVNRETEMAPDFTSNFPQHGMDRVGYENGHAVFEYQTGVADTGEYRVRCPYGQPGDRLWGITIKPVLGFEERYGAGDDGRIYRIDCQQPKPMRGSPTNKGYLGVSLCRGGTKQTALVHRLVCEAFYGPKPGIYDEIRHLDGDQTNNRPENLDWGTRQQNWADRRFAGHGIGEQHHAAKLTKDQAAEIRASILPQRKLAKAYSVSQSTISDIKKGNIWKPFPSREPPNFARWASRITLEIAGVRVERLQAISEDDAWAEGFPDPEGRNREYADRARYWFKTLWGEINGKESWDANPWVWVIEFRKIDAQGVSS